MLDSLQKTASHAPGDTRERDNFVLILAHLSSHGVHWARRASSTIDEAKLSSFGIKPGARLEAIFEELLASAPNSGTNPVLRSLDMLDSLGDGERQVIQARIVSAHELGRGLRVLSLRDGLESEVTHPGELDTLGLEALQATLDLRKNRTELLEALLEELHRGGDALARHGKCVR